MEQFRFVLLELFVIETNIARCLRINVVGQDGIRSKLTKTIKVQLPGETRKVAVLKVKRKDSTCKFFDVLYDEIISRRGPSRDLLIASIDHVVGFAQKQGKLMLFRTTLNFCHRSFGGNGRAAARATAAAVRCCCRGWHRLLLRLRRKNNRSDSGSIKKSMHAEWLPGNSAGHRRNSGSHNRRRRRIRG